MTPWAETLVGVVLVSALSLAGGLVLLLKGDGLRRALEVLVPFAAGALIGEAVIHAIPEVAESPDGFGVAASVAMTAGIVSFFALEKILHWHHAHFPSEDVIHPVAVSNLVGDGLHNFVDGAIIAAGFLASWEVGVATVVAVAIHEIPQELGDFAIMLKSGLTRQARVAPQFLECPRRDRGGRDHPVDRIQRVGRTFPGPVLCRSVPLHRQRRPPARTAQGVRNEQVADPARGARGWDLGDVVAAELRIGGEMAGTGQATKQRSTRQRAAITGALNDAGGFRSAQELHERLRDAGISVGLTDRLPDPAVAGRCRRDRRRTPRGRRMRLQALCDGRPSPPPRVPQLWLLGRDRQRRGREMGRGRGARPRLRRRHARPRDLRTLQGLLEAASR